jgi:hypothetical protein
MIMESSLHPESSNKHFLVHNQIKDKRISNCYPQLQGKIEAYNKIVKNEFLALEDDIPSMEDGKLRYDMFVKAYNESKRAWRNQSMASPHQRCFYKG